MSCWYKPAIKIGNGESRSRSKGTERRGCSSRGSLGCRGTGKAIRERLNGNGQPWREGALTHISVPDFPAVLVGKAVCDGGQSSERPISEKEEVKSRVKTILYP